MTGINDCAIADALVVMAHVMGQENQDVLNQNGMADEFIGIYYEDIWARSIHCKSVSEKKSGNKNHGKNYEATVDKGKCKALCGKETSERGTVVSVICFSCGGTGHHANECKSSGQKCSKCGNPGHRIADCKRNMLTCFNYGEPGHISTQCQKPKKAWFGGKVFALSGAESNRYDNLIRCMCFINGVSLIVMIDMGAENLFISRDYARKLNL
ncbi:uncharacterized protein LOC127081038 [Lathyrus oleraceus]|uniref:uncharacterized protein LOC127081038 n=1 Tax=Pisum sativum TaxID=3888 RepID=UPI0021CEE7F5|nr:uncharacterized protein LOC127081038 [Pisum sativum]